MRIQGIQGGSLRQPPLAITCTTCNLLLQLRSNLTLFSAVRLRYRRRHVLQRALQFGQSIPRSVLELPVRVESPPSVTFGVQVLDLLLHLLAYFRRQRPEHRRDVLAGELQSAGGRGFSISVSRCSLGF
jgi:hypothetical protein